MSQEERFSQWLKENKELSDSSIDKYVGAVRTIGRLLSGEVGRKIDFYSIDTEDEFRSIKVLINEDHPKTLQRYQTGHNMYSIAISNYGQFLTKYRSLKDNWVYLDEIKEEDVLYIEGTQKVVNTIVYERDPKARKKCIDYHGSCCAICGFDAKKVYGEQFAGKIEVHHKTPLKEIREAYRVDPIHELIPVCPNCHMILHLGDPVFTPEEVIDFLNLSHSKKGPPF